MLHGRIIRHGFAPGVALTRGMHPRVACPPYLMHTVLHTLRSVRIRAYPPSSVRHPPDADDDVDSANAGARADRAHGRVDVVQLYAPAAVVDTRRVVAQPLLVGGLATMVPQVHALVRIHAEGVAAIPTAQVPWHALALEAHQTLAALERGLKQAKWAWRVWCWGLGWRLRPSAERWRSAVGRTRRVGWCGWRRAQPRYGALRFTQIGRRRAYGHKRTPRVHAACAWVDADSVHAHTACSRPASPSCTGTASSASGIWVGGSLGKGELSRLQANGVMPSDTRRRPAAVVLCPALPLPSPSPADNCACCHPTPSQPRKHPAHIGRRSHNRHSCITRWGEFWDSIS